MTPLTAVRTGQGPRWWYYFQAARRGLMQGDALRAGDRAYYCRASTVADGRGGEGGDYLAISPPARHA